MTSVWIQCASGASGDMFLAALVDAGAPLATVRAAVDAVGVDGIELDEERVRRGGMAALKVHVRTRETHHHRGWTQIRDLLTAAGPGLTAPARDRALRAFRLLAEAESRVHGVPLDDVHFHEIGALDAIADIVGACAALDALGAGRVTADRVAVGSGTVRTEHGTLPVPVPAVVDLLAAAGATTFAGPAERELCTPTGAALLAAVVDEWCPQPAMRVTGTGTGAGTADLANAPNVLRVLFGTEQYGGHAAAVPERAAVLLETNVDDLDPRLWPEVLSRLIRAGADDAWLTPILMKKGRPAHVLAALAVPAVADAVRTTIFAETSAIGVRTSAVGKHALPRTEEVVEVAGNAVRVKIAWSGGERVNAQPEYDDLLAAAAASGLPVKTVLADALARLPDSGGAPAGPVRT